MPRLPFQVRRLCNMGATVAMLLAPAAAAAQPSQSSEPAQPEAHRAAETVKFLGGAGAAFVAHEMGHLVFDVIFDADPRFQTVHFGPFPFFAIAHRSDLSPRREFTVSSAGFWTQEAASEWILTRHPDLRHEHAPFAKGALAFDILTELGYGMVALARAGPIERDTRGMAATGVDERAIGVLVIAPAALDAYRYFNPETRWATWASRIAKASSVVLVLK